MPSKYRVTTDQGVFEVTVDDSAPASSPQSDSGAVGMAGTAAVLPAVLHGAEAVATSPTLPRTVGAVARGLTTAGAIGQGLYTGNPTQVLAAPMEGWAAGKGGYFLGKGLQAVASPVARIMGKVAPYAQSLSTLSGAQGMNDLAQMAEPNRKDIGFMGLGPSVDVPGAEPPALNRLYAYLRGRISGR